MSRQYRKEHFAFVSHANSDKETGKIAPVVRALTDAGLKVWLDNPSRKLGFSEAEIEALFHNLRGDGDWDDQIDEGLKTAGCIVICVTNSFMDRLENKGAAGRVINREVNYALVEKRAIVVRIDDVAFERLHVFDRKQIIDLCETPTKIAQLPADVKRMLERLQLERIAQPSRLTTESRDPFAPYLVDRKRQEAAAKVAIRAAADGGVQALFVKGPRNECAHQFRERLTRHISPDCLQHEGCWEHVEIDWPPIDSPDAFAAAYEASLTWKLGVRAADLRRRLSEGRAAPLALVSVIGLSDWKPRGRELVLTWLEFWKTLEREHGAAKVVPVLAVDLPECDPGWKTAPNVRKSGMSAGKVWKDVGDASKLAEKSTNYIPLVRLDVLHPISDDDAHKWRSAHVADSASALWRKTGEEIDRLFATRGAKKKGVTNEVFAKALGRHFVASAG